MQTVSIFLPGKYSRHNQSVDCSETVSYMVKNVKISLVLPLILFFLVFVFALFMDNPSSHALRKKCMWSDNVMLSCMAKHQNKGF
ncbi:hypothetical protein WP5S18E01_26740 [Enterobacter cloacae]|jgi:hypothetical protein|nr:hypothetical protein WP5S18E01_26740 [Enterobacter cloacae]